MRKSVPLKQSISPLVLAYAAGVIEGDGTICISESSYAHTSVYVSNGNLRLLEWLKLNIGGWVSEKSCPSQMGRSPQFQWKLSSGDTGRFCGLILPYLVGKRRQGELAVEAAGLKAQFRGRKPAAIRRRLTEITEECSWWNQQGWRADNEEEPPEHDSGPSQIRLVV